jgi:hypothetical protein
VITEPQYGRWKTLSKNVFNINPNGQLQGVSFGLTSNKPPWKIQAPEVPLCGFVRTLSELEEVEERSGSNMEIDRPHGTLEVGIAQEGKRRRVDMLQPASAFGMCDDTVNSLLFSPIPQENIQHAPPIMRGLSPQENNLSGSMACQDNNMGICMTPPLLNFNSLVGKHMGFTGSTLNFQKPLEAHNFSVGPEIITSADPSIVVDRVKSQRSQKSPKGASKAESVQGPNKISSSMEVLTKSPQELETFSTNKSTSPPEEQCSSNNGAGVLLFSNVGSSTMGGRVQTESPPYLCRSTDLRDEASKNPKTSPGQTPNYPSVMGPVLTHHEP